nr:hypothetical protein [Tanacetum cinerariifolium]
MEKLIKNNRILLNNNIFPHEEASMEVLLAMERILKLIQAWDDKQIESWSLPELLPQLLNDSRTIDEMLKQQHSIQYNEYFKNSSNAITTVLPTEEPKYSLSMGYKHLSTILETESDEVIKYSVKNLVQFPSDDDESLHNEDVLMENFKVYSNPLFDDEEINSDKIDPHYFNAESDLIEYLSNRDTLFDSSPKFDYLEEFSGELMPINIVNEERIKRENEEYIIEDGNSLREEIDIFTSTDDLMPPGIESNDYDSEGDIRFLEELLSNDSISLLENESSNFDHHDDPSFPLPPLEPPDVEFFFDFEPNSGELISAVMNIIDELNEDECFDPGEDCPTMFEDSRVDMSKITKKRPKPDKNEHEIVKNIQKPHLKIFLCPKSQQKPITIQRTGLAISER